MLKSDCISVAGSDVKYNNLPENLKAKGEYQFLKRSLSSAPHGIDQGVFVITPSGKLITKINWGWPLPDVSAMNMQLEQSIIDYKKMPKIKRLGKLRLTEKDRSLPREKSLIPPQSWLCLRNTSRSYAFSGMNQFDIRHPSFVTVDKLWFSDNEKFQFIPSDVSSGMSEKIKQEPLNRLLLNSHLINGRSAWWQEHIKLADVTMKVMSVKADLVEIQYEGKVNMLANSQWCKESYTGKILGKALWNTSSKSFASFEWVALGNHKIDELKPNMDKGDTNTVAVAAKLIFDPRPKCEIGIPPASWPEQYSEKMQARVKSQE